MDHNIVDKNQGLIKGIAPNFKNTVYVLGAFVLWKVFFYLLFPAISLQASDLTVENILNSINKEREMRQIAVLMPNDKLSSAADFKARDMIVRKYFSHTNPEGEYIWPKIVEFGYTPYLQLGENLAIEFYNTESLVSAWMNSPTHRANVLNEGFKDQGMGIAFGQPSNGEFYSSIANTFGALLQTKKTVPAPAPAPAPTPPKQTATVKPKTPAAPAPSKKTAVKPPKPIIPPALKETPAPPPAPTLPKTQGEQDTQIPPPTDETNNQKKEPADNSAGQTLPPEIEQTAPETETKTTSPQASSVPEQKTSTSLFSKLSTTSTFNPYQLNRYATLGFGAILCLLMIFDIKNVLDKKLLYIDKKINNFVVLLLSLIVVAIMYWL